MKIQMSCNNGYISISFYKINFLKLKQLFDCMDVSSVTVFLDEHGKYLLDSVVSVKDFIQYTSKVKTSIIMFDGIVESCLVDKEIEVLANKKILVDIDLFEDLTTILINTNNTEITKENIKKIFKK